MTVQQTVSFNFTTDSSAPTLPSNEPASIFRPADISFADLPRRSAEEPLPPIPAPDQQTPPPEIAPSPPLATSSPTRPSRPYRSASFPTSDDDDVFVSADPAIPSAASEPELGRPSTSAGYIEPIVRIADPIGVEVRWPSSEFENSDEEEEVIYEQTGF